MTTPISPTTGRPLPASASYTGGCHCGLVSYTVRLSPPLIPSPSDLTTKPMPVTQCNCSICHINGQLMVYPLESQITWHSGRDDMTGYTFGPTRITHSFCPRCGTSIGGKSNEPGAFKDNRALNVRTFRDVDLGKLTFRQIDGRSLVPTKEYSYDPTKHPHNGFGSRIM